MMGNSYGNLHQVHVTRDMLASGSLKIILENGDDNISCC